MSVRRREFKKDIKDDDDLLSTLMTMVHDRDQGRSRLSRLEFVNEILDVLDRAVKRLSPARLPGDLKPREPRAQAACTLLACNQPMHCAAAGVCLARREV